MALTQVRAAASVDSRHVDTSRRRFVAFLAGSPLLAAAGLDAGIVRDLLRGGGHADRDTCDLVGQLQQAPLITKEQDALDVFDFEPVPPVSVPGSAVQGQE